MREYRINEGSIHERFLKSTAKIQVFGGGFGNGKTAASCIKAIQLIRDYPGCNGLIARATFPKLNDTIRKEFKAWCPPSMIQAFPTSKNSDNTAKFNNGSHVNFRYIAQQGKSAESTTSNLLSATYDFAIIDQMEDPEITEKDFYDILGRLRGNTIYRGRDPNMPKTGPRFLILTCNPTANWFYKRIIRPLKLYEETGRVNDDLLCERDEDGAPILGPDGKPILLVELFEAPTYANKDNLGADFIKTLESTYRGQMKDRFLMGKWASYEGLIYPEYDETMHGVEKSLMFNYMELLAHRSYQMQFIEGYDYGIASPSCYILAFVDPFGMVHIVDGFYEKEYPIEKQAAHILRIRREYGVPDQMIYGDPDIFRRKGRTTGTVGISTAGLFSEVAPTLRFRRGNNDILNGIAKVSSYLTPHPSIRSPYTGDTGAPLIFHNTDLTWISDEFTSYMWAKDPNGKSIDQPIDKDDHAMDTIKYMLSDRPSVGKILRPLSYVPSYMKWQERSDEDDPRYARYG